MTCNMDHMDLFPTPSPVPPLNTRHHGLWRGDESTNDHLVAPKAQAIAQKAQAIALKKR